MSVANTVTMTSGLYVPYSTKRRGGRQGDKPVGTLMVDGGAIGDASGGNVQININMGRLEFGFHPLWVLTSMVAWRVDSVADFVRFIFQNAGNRRLNTTMIEVVQGVDDGGLVGAIASQRAVVIEPNVDVETAVLSAVFGTNTNTINYHFHCYGVVFDGEYLAKYGEVSEMLAGLT